MRSSTLSFWLSFTDPAARAFLAILPFTSCDQSNQSPSRIGGTTAAECNGGGGT
ncbi:unnamed protein product [Ectocarpus sp. 8 AP-2014]